ncbi:hypothetical protein OESDEN_19320 [Oesophagostomum dentatum]|uniref:Uncharacterized protein n=1 Tax=Oesophagostomum dentatum TaxID=61180 RepID=A0A0B1S6M5_OESDE|nr:hypothetical protein OESDEN_19320 [Oesophagostomum dentatum]
MRGNLPWCNLRSEINAVFTKFFNNCVIVREKKDINEMKKRTPHETLLKNSPIQFVEFARHLDTLNYYSHPDYALLYNHLMEIMKAGKFKFTDPYDWEKKRTIRMIRKIRPITYSTASCSLKVEAPATGLAKLKSSLLKPFQGTDENPFPADWFQTNPLGF